VSNGEDTFVSLVVIERLDLGKGKGRNLRGFQFDSLGGELNRSKPITKKRKGRETTPRGKKERGGEGEGGGGNQGPLYPCLLVISIERDEDTKKKGKKEREERKGRSTFPEVPRHGIFTSKRKPIRRKLSKKKGKKGVI